MNYLLAALFMTLSPNADMPLLFEKMAGDWIAEGQRVSTLSGKKVRLQCKVHAEVKVRGDELILVSRNEWTETFEKGEIHEYSRVYWLRSNGAIYELGYGDGEKLEPAAEGTFDGSFFEVSQEIGENPVVLVRSRTEFLADGSGSVYHEKSWYDGRQISEATVRYTGAR